MYAITKYTNTFNWGVSTWVSFLDDKYYALDIFASLVQQELFFLDEEEWFEEFIDKHTKSNYSELVETITVWWRSLEMGTSPQGMISVEYFDGDTDVYRFQMVECKEGLSISL